MTSLLQDLRYGIRMLAKAPGFTAIAVLTLGLGIGATTAVFSVLDHVALRPLPYRNPEELVLPRFTSTNEFFATHRPLTKTEVSAWKEDGQVFSEQTAFWGGGGTWTDGEEPISLSGHEVETNFFDVLGVRPFAGRMFSPDDARADAPPVAVVSYAFWQGPLGGDPEVLGRRLTMDETIYTIIGVLPADFRSPNSSTKDSIWTPLETTDGYRSGTSWLGMVGRLRPGVTIEQAEGRLTLLATGLPDLKEAPRKDVWIESIQENVVGSQQSLFVLMGAVVFVLLIACANLAHLLLARATTRRREMAIRKALGASGGRLARQLLVESLLLSLCGCALGVLVAAWALPLMLSMAPFWLPRLDQVTIDGRVFAFAVGLSILTALLFGMAPAMQSARRPLRAVLQNATSVAATSFRETRFRDALVVGEIALCLVLLVGAGLLIGTFWRTRPVDVGFNPENRVVAQLSLQWEKYANQPDRQRAYMREALDRLRAIPSVTDVAGMNMMPFPGLHAYTKFAKSAEPIDQVPRSRNAFLRRIMPNYFRVLEIPLISGSGFPDDAGAGSAPIAIVNQTLAESLWPTENAVGQLLRIQEVSNGDVLHRVVGVAGDTRTDGRAVKADPEILIPFMQQPMPAVTFVVKTQADSNQILGAVRAQLLAMEPDRPLGRLGTMGQLLWQDKAVVQRHFDAWLIGVFSLLGLVLAMVGVFGVIAYFISQRTREIGLRMALGAQEHQILWLVMRRGLKLVLLGILVGVAASLGLTRLIASRLADVSATDPATFIAMSALLAAVASLAILLPARRAARVDPMTALRYE